MRMFVYPALSHQSLASSSLAHPEALPMLPACAPRSCRPVDILAKSLLSVAADVVETVECTFFSRLLNSIGAGSEGAHDMSKPGTKPGTNRGARCSDQTAVRPTGLNRGVTCEHCSHTLREGYGGAAQATHREGRD